MGDPWNRSPSLLTRLLRNPVALRKRSRIVAVGVALLAALAGSGVLGSGPLSAALTAVAWLCVPLVAAGIGIGDAFFLRHGIGDRRVALTLLLGAVTALASCAVLAVVSSPGNQEMLLTGGLYFLLVCGMIGVLSAGIAIAAGKAGGYLSRRIQDIDDTNW